ncbi:hypothetical protein [Microbacterium sp. NPDC079995]|uniref:TetR/AcrR family transcriptional regulator n=1 Tax=unclassified Microbacterium TaxID=2609290 RepID=UPI003450055F
MISQQEQRRTILSASTDDASRETRRRIIDAYLAAGAEPSARPSVTQLCRLAGVGRSTFYTHFATIADVSLSAVLLRMEDISSLEVEMRRADQTGWEAITRASLTELVQVVLSAREEIAFAVDTVSRAAVCDTLAEILRTNTLPIVEAVYEGDQATKLLVAEFLSAGTSRAILRWLDDPDAVTPDQLTDVILGLIPRQLSNPE